MKKELGTGPLIAIVVVGLAVIGGVVYAAFFRSSGYTAEEAAKNDAMTQVSDQRFLERHPDAATGGGAATEGQGLPPEAAARGGN